jgi:hypothetical protein
MQTISDLVERFKGLWYGESKQEIEGYHIMTDNINNRSLVMVKESEKSWKTKWFNNEENNFTAPKEPITKIFSN